MFRNRWFVVAAAAAVACVAGTASVVFAQATITSTQPNTVLVPPGGTLSNSPYNQYGGGYPGYYPYMPYEYYNNLQGMAAVIQAQGQIMESQQKAFLDKEKVRSARLDNRKKELEQFLWEREHMPTSEDDRQRQAMITLSRDRFGADSTEIWSARALNSLLDDLRRNSPSAEGSPTVTDDVLAKINVTSGKGNIGLLKNGRLSFPLLLKRPEFEKETAHLNHLAQRVVKEANEGAIKAEDIEEMSRTAAQVTQKLTGMAREAGDNANWDQAMYTSARNFLTQLDDAITVLRQPGAANFLSDKYNLKGKGRNIGDIARFMIDNGVRFAPATAGSEADYNAVYDALRIYDKQTGTKTPESK